MQTWKDKNTEAVNKTEERNAIIKARWNILLYRLELQKNIGI